MISIIRYLLFMISFNTSVAIWSVLCKSVGSPDVQTHLNGPKPRENMSLYKNWNEKTLIKRNKKDLSRMFLLYIERMNDPIVNY